MRGPRDVPALLSGTLIGLQRRKRKVFRVFVGGSSPFGVIGAVELGLELAEQVDQGLLPEPDAVYVALGTGGTTVGLALGLAAAGITSDIVAVRVTERWMTHRWTLLALAHGTVRALRQAGAPFPDVAKLALSRVTVDGAQLGAGYGHGTEAGRAAMARGEALGLVLDPTYTAKAFAALLADAEGVRAGQRLLFVSTLNSHPMGRWLDEGARAPRVGAVAHAASAGSAGAWPVIFLKYQVAPTKRNFGSRKKLGGLPSKAWPMNWRIQPKTKSAMPMGGTKNMSGRLARIIGMPTMWVALLTGCWWSRR